jgi:hypothetical protein
MLVGDCAKVVESPKGLMEFICIFPVDGKECGISALG